VIFDAAGTALAFVRNDGLYSYAGRHLGRFHRGFFRDSEGNAVAFVRGAEGGPLPPLPELPPLPPLPSLPPLPPIPALPPLPPLPTLGWSRLSWNAYADGDEDD
jgi:hypothetical protein